MTKPYPSNEEVARSSIGDVERIARTIAARIEGLLADRLIRTYGPNWLAVVNQTRTANGMAAGKGLFDYWFCLSLFADDPGTAGWADEGWRDLVHELTDLAHRAACDGQFTDEDIVRARHIDQLFASGFSGEDHPELTTRRLLREGDLPGAEEAALRWVGLEPRNQDALMHLGLVYRESGRYTEMLGVAEKLRPLDPKSAAAGASQAWMAMKRWPELLVSAREWVRNAPNHKDAWLSLFAAADELDDAAVRVEAIRGMGQFEPNALARRRSLARR